MSFAKASAMSFPRAKRGVAAIEFAIVSPLLVLLLVGLVEVGLVCYQTMQVQSAAEAGALYAAKYGFDAAGIEAAVVNATELSGMSASPQPRSYCGCPDADGVSAVSCSGTCPDGAAPGEYAEVHAAFTHTPIVPYPWPSSPLVLTGEAVLRLK